MALEPRCTILTQWTPACKDAAIYRPIYPLRCDVYCFPGLLVHHSTRPLHYCHQIYFGGFRTPCLRDVGTRKRQLFFLSHTQDLLCVAGFTTSELSILVYLLHTHRHAKVLQIVWFGMICRVAYRVVTGQGASDDRSDEEDR